MKKGFSCCQRIASGPLLVKREIVCDESEIGDKIQYFKERGFELSKKSRASGYPGRKYFRLIFKK